MRINIAYLISSDTDLVQAVEEVHSFGKKVIYVECQKVNPWLTKPDDDTILLRAEDILPHIPIEED